MKIIAKSFPVILITLLGAQAATAQGLSGSEWKPVELGGKSFQPISEIFLRFDQDARFFGNAGCNTFRGQFVTNSDAILFSPAATTMMACTDEISQHEFSFLKALDSARQFRRDGTTLELTDASGKSVLRFVQQDAD